MEQLDGHMWNNQCWQKNKITGGKEIWEFNECKASSENPVRGGMWRFCFLFSQYNRTTAIFVWGLTA